MRRVAAEFVGTYALVFAGAGAMIVNAWSGGLVTHVGVALVFGLVVGAMVMAFGRVSGAHINPAVTIALAWAGRFEARGVVWYVAAQCAGAIAASVTHVVLFPASETLGGTIPAVGAWRSLVIEALLTFLLVLVVLRVAFGEGRAAPEDRVAWVAGAAGAVVAMEALFAGPLTGASMNPARSLGPALVSGRLEGLWVYVVGPVAGAVIAAAVDAWITRRGSLRVLPRRDRSMSA